MESGRITSRCLTPRSAVSFWPLEMAAACLTLLCALILASGCRVAGNSQKQPQLWLDCSCLHANERNATQWGSLSINASHVLGAKNNCLMIFIGGMVDELVAFQPQQLQLRPG
ncbi:GH20581 [Drosophila grimshawi]|uniref:GH20581 n=1 Tax=Drosophila grimshawi TaxID=7222 RepID=B4JRF1_DROGR|nr:GH20581 [Drosophila grimshawi]